MFNGGQTLRSGLRLPGGTHRETLRGILFAASPRCRETWRFSKASGFRND